VGEGRNRDEVREVATLKWNPDIFSIKVRNFPFVIRGGEVIRAGGSRRIERRARKTQSSGRRGEGTLYPGGEST